MILQADRPIAVWGKANPREAVTVTLGGHNAHVVAGKDGRWRVAMPSMPASFDPAGRLGAEHARISQ